jgi:hypothetical protein
MTRPIQYSLIVAALTAARRRQAGLLKSQRSGRRLRLFRKPTPLSR